jgi:hypothetical protein
LRLYVEANFVYSATDPLDAYYKDCGELLDLAEKGEVEIALPRMAQIEATRGFPNKHLARMKKIEDLKTLVTNGQRAGIDHARKIDIDDFDTKARALLETLKDRKQALQRIDKVAVQLEPGVGFIATLTSLTAALTTGLSSRPIDMEEMDRLIFASIVNHLENNPAESGAMFCTLDKDMYKASLAALTLYDSPILLSNSFKKAIKWIEKSPDWSTD